MKQTLLILCIAAAIGVLTLPVRAQLAVTPQRIAEAIERGQAHWTIDATQTTAQRSLAILRALSGETGGDISADVAALLSWQQESGGWGYGPDHPHTQSYPAWSDLSNTHLAVTALLAARNHGVPIDDAVFTRAHAYAITCRNGDGGFGLTGPDTRPIRLRGASHGDATAAGLGILFTCPAPEALQGQLAGNLGAAIGYLAAQPLLPQPGWQWGEHQRDDILYLWRLAQMNDAGHFRDFNGQSIRMIVAQALLDTQNADGTWGEGQEQALSTALAVDALRTLARPVLVNRLAPPTHDGAAMTYLLTTLSATGETDMTWQAVTWDTEPEALNEAPLWWIVIDGPIQMTAAMSERIRDYTASGRPLIVEVASADGALIEQTAAILDTMLPAWSAQPLENFTAIRDIHIDGELDLACLAGGVGFGDSARLAVAVLPPTPSRALQSPETCPASTLGTMHNLVRLMTGEQTPRGYDAFVSVSAETPRMVAPAFGIGVARVAIGEEWSNAPGVFPTMSTIIADAVSLGVRELPPTDLTMPVDDRVRLLWLTGTNWPALSTAQQDHLQAFLDGGGLLVATPTTGRVAQASDARLWLEATFPEPLQALPSYHPLNSGQFGGSMGNGLDTTIYNEATTSPPHGSGLEAITQQDRQPVIFCPYGLLAAAEGTPAWNNPAPITDDARRIIANLLLYALSGE
jgi:hypothetical protein